MDGVGIVNLYSTNGNRTFQARHPVAGNPLATGYLVSFEYELSYSLERSAQRWPSLYRLILRDRTFQTLVWNETMGALSAGVLLRDMLMVMPFPFTAS